MANVNNEANFQEVEAHCKLASAKLAQLLQQQPDGTTALEDLEDYWERQLQLRVMQNNTLLEQLKEARGEYAGLRDRILASFGGVVGLVGAYLIAADPWTAIGAVRTYWSYATVAVITYCGARIKF